MSNASSRSGRAGRSGRPTPERSHRRGQAAERDRSSAARGGMRRLPQSGLQAWPGRTGLPRRDLRQGPGGPISGPEGGQNEVMVTEYWDGALWT